MCVRSHTQGVVKASAKNTCSAVEVAIHTFFGVSLFSFWHIYMGLMLNQMLMSCPSRTEWPTLGKKIGKVTPCLGVRSIDYLCIEVSAPTQDVMNVSTKQTC